jgi:hypothetical protein
VRGDAVGLPNLGLVDIQPEHLARLVQLRRALDALLDQDETYLDLTNRNAEYYYLNRPVPIESGALYNLPNDVQQLRAIDRLAAAPVPVILAGGDAIAHDGGPPSLRTHVIYRYVMGLGYTPIRVGPLVLLVRPDRVERARASGLAVGGDRAAMLDLSFRLPDLGRIPESWGLSWPTLREAVTEVRRIDAAPLLLHDVEAVGADTYRVAGRDPFVVWPLAPAQDGRAAGILTFDFACTQGDGNTNLAIYWHAPEAPTTADTGVTLHAAAHVAVPLDAAPRWLTQPALDQLRVDVDHPDHCPVFRLQQLTLWQRRTAAEVEARLQRYH